MCSVWIKMNANIKQIQNNNKQSNQNIKTQGRKIRKQRVLRGSAKSCLHPCLQAHHTWGFHCSSLQGFKNFYNWLHMCQSTFTTRDYSKSLNSSVFHTYYHLKIKITSKFNAQGRLYTQ